MGTLNQGPYVGVEEAAGLAVRGSDGCEVGPRDVPEHASQGAGLTQYQRWWVTLPQVDASTVQPVFDVLVDSTRVRPVMQGTGFVDDLVPVHQARFPQVGHSLGDILPWLSLAGVGLRDDPAPLQFVEQEPYARRDGPVLSVLFDQLQTRPL